MNLALGVEEDADGDGDEADEAADHGATGTRTSDAAPLGTELGDLLLCRLR